MELEALGFDEWYREKQTQGKSPDWTPARVTAVDRDSYLIRNGNSEVRAELAGNFMFNAQSEHGPAVRGGLGLRPVLRRRNFCDHL